MKKRKRLKMTDEVLRAPPAAWPEPFGAHLPDSVEPVAPPPNPSLQINALVNAKLDRLLSDISYLVDRMEGLESQITVLSRRLDRVADDTVTRFKIAMGETP